ncbi:MAG: PEP/pyruvate-binding domain-containing protein, partial [Gammaproteobacteria bacterium]
GKTLDDLFKLEDLYDDLKQFYSESVISDLITLKCENLRNDTSIPQNQLGKRIIFYSQLLKFHTEQNTADTPAVNDLSQEDYNNSTNDLARTYGGKYKGLVESENMLQQVNKQNPDLNIAIPRFIGLSTQETEAAVKNERCPNKLLAFLQDYKNKPDIRFMVRSSSTQEDQSGQSNAGCYKTISNVNHSPEAILDAIKEVYQAFSSDNAHAQSALYSSNGNSSSPHQNHGAVLIQIMMGETNQNEPNTVSGVGLLPDPRSHAPGTFNLNAAPGHGEGIVQGKITTDETIGVIDKKTQSVHARSRINNKPTRLTPNADANGLIKTENPQYLRQQAALSPESVETMALALNTLSERHKEGVDMEFVAQGHSHYLVQQRSQDARHAEIKPAYLKTASVEKYQAELHRVQVISHSNLGVNIIKPQERINAHSLDDAFYKDYLGMQKTAKETGVEAQKLKAVFVKPPAHPNAHAALMFRQQGIAIVQISDAKTYDTIATSSQSVLLDEQR